MLRNWQEKINAWKDTLLQSKAAGVQRWFTSFSDGDSLSHRYLNRRLIFLIDIALVAVSMLVLFGALYSLDLKKYTIGEYSLIFFIQCFSYAIAFYLFRTYQGVVRHSTIYDLINIFLASTLAFITLNIAELIYQSVNGESLFIFQVIFVNYLAIILSLTFFRIAVKYFFEHLYRRQGGGELKKVLIAGTNHSAVTLAQGLLAEKPAKFDPVGFLTESPNGQDTRILNRNIYPMDPVSLRKLKREGVDGVIIMPDRFTYIELNAITDVCLDAELGIYKYGIIDGDDPNEAYNSGKVERFNIEDLLGREPICIDNRRNEQEYNGKTIMVTGAAGSIGSEIVRQLLNYRPERLVLIDQAETPLADLKLELDHSDLHVGFHFIVENICNPQVMDKLFDTYAPDIIFHAAAYKHVPMMEEQPARAIINNVEGTIILADLANKYGAEKMILISTDKAVNPSNVMGATKRIAECYLQLMQKVLNGGNQTQYITTRFGNVLGSNGSVIPIFSRQIDQGGPVTITHPDIIRYFMTIPEACQLVLEACTMGKDGQILIFDMGKPVKILDLAKKMIYLSGFTPGKDIPIEITGLRPGEKMFEELINDSAEVEASHHPKIMILSDSDPPGNGTLLKKIRNLILSCEHGDAETLVALMLDIVPEYTPENTSYEKIISRNSNIHELVSSAGSSR